MNEYLMIFRNAQSDAMPTSEQMQAVVLQWQNWIGDIVRKGRYSGTNRLMKDGKTVKTGKVVTDGPYAEGKEVVGGYLIVKAATMDEAVEMAHGCPGLLIGGTVEVRSVMPIEYNAASPNFLEEKVPA
jgi:hypothetical protein